MESGERFGKTKQYERKSGREKGKERGAGSPGQRAKPIEQGVSVFEYKERRRRGQWKGDVMMWMRFSIDFASYEGQNFKTS